MDCVQTNASASHLSDERPAELKRTRFEFDAYLKAVAWQDIKKGGAFAKRHSVLKDIKDGKALRMAAFIGEELVIWCDFDATKEDGDDWPTPAMIKQGAAIVELFADSASPEAVARLTFDAMNNMKA